MRLSRRVNVRRIRGALFEVLMDHFESWRLFRTIVEGGSFRRAGQMVGVSPSVPARVPAFIDHAVAYFEER